MTGLRSNLGGLLRDPFREVFWLLRCEEELFEGLSSMLKDLLWRDCFLASRFRASLAAMDWRLISVPSLLSLFRLCLKASRQKLY